MTDPSPPAARPDHRAMAAIRAEAFHVAAAQVSDALLVSTLLDDGTHVVLWVNEAFERLTEWRADDVLGRSPGVLIGPETDRDLVDEMLDAMQQGIPVHQRLVLHRRDGAPFVVEAKYVTLWSEPTSQLWILRDVSDVAATEEALRRTEQWARAIIENTDDVLVQTDGEGIVTYAGPSLQHVLRLAPE